MCPDVISMGEILVEIMRKDLDVPHDVTGIYVGPYPSGAPAIFIDAAAKLGANSGFIGVVGEDEFGDLLLNRLGEDGVDTSHIRVARGYTTGTAFNMYYSTGERRFVFHLRHSAAGQLSPNDIKEEYLTSSKILHIMGSALAVSESSRKACYRAAELAQESGVTVTFDPNLRPELLDIKTIRKICEPVLQVSRVVLPSKSEAKTLTGKDDPAQASRSLIKMGADVAVIKMGSEGALAVTQTETIFEPAFRVLEVDPTGAGDVYDAAFVYGMLKDWSLDKTMELASAVGAIKVTRVGPMSGLSSLKEVEEFIRKTAKRQTSTSTASLD